MSAAVFTAKDAAQRRHLLDCIGYGFDWPVATDVVAERAFEGEETSSYLLSFYVIGIDLGRQWGEDDAYDAVYGNSAQAVAVRTRARTKRRHRARKGRKR